MLVLVVDDDTTCRLVAKAAVERLGHDCIAAEDGIRAWEMIKDRAVDVLVTDWLMPGLDGPELCRRVRGAAERGYTYIILATSRCEPDQIIEGMEAGADDYLTKPLDPFDLRARLIAATRVTGLHRQITDFRDELESLNAAVGLQARTDTLTQLGNRLRLREDLEAAHHQARRSRKPYSIALCDIDGFKTYNDAHGHLQGDEALRLVGEAIERNCRAHERAYRYGGDEFVIVYRDEELDGARVAGERLRGAVEALEIPHAGKTPALMTISVGVATWDLEAEWDIGTTLKEADAALYEAKETGRNRVAVRRVGTVEVESVVAGTRP